MCSLLSQKYAYQENWGEGELPNLEPESYPVLGDFIPIIDEWLDIGYHLHFVQCSVFPQGYAAMVPMMDVDKQYNNFQKFTGTVMMADVGNGTMNIMRLENGRPLDQYCWTEVLGVHQCALTIRKQMMDKDGLDLPEDVIEQFLRTGKTHLRKEILESMNAIARGYVSGLFDALRVHGYDPRMMKLYVLGGGGCLMKRFGQYDPESVAFVDNLNAAAKGYEYMAQGLATLEDPSWWKHPETSLGNGAYYLA